MNTLADLKFLIPMQGLYGKFVLCMLDLTQIELATEEDKSYGIDYWARLFKAETWEELKMIAKNDKYLMKASETLYSLHCDQTIQDMCCAREDYIRLHIPSIERLQIWKQITKSSAPITKNSEQP